MASSQLPCLGRRPCVVTLSPKHQRIGRRPLRRRVLTAMLGLIAVVAAQKATNAADGMNVEVNDDRLTVVADDVPVHDLLEEIARQAGVALSLPNALPQRVTVEFDGLTLPVGIDRLLHGMSYAFRYSPGSTENKLWVFASGRSSTDASAEPFVELGSPPPVDDGVAMRLEAVAALADQETDPFAFALASAVVDDSPAVRFEAVHALGEIGGAVSARLLQHALLDADASSI